MKTRILLFLILFAAILSFPSCDKNDTDSTAREKYFINQSKYLGEGVELTECGKWLRLPKDYSAASDSILELLQSTLDAYKDRMYQITMTHCFLDTLRQSGLLVTQIKGFTLDDDTAVFFNNYRQVLESLYGHAGILEGGETVNDSVLIRYFIVSDRKIARFQAVCLTRQQDAVELNFFMPDSLYQSTLPAIKSSLSTVKVSSQPDGDS